VHDPVNDGLRGKLTVGGDSVGEVEQTMTAQDALVRAAGTQDVDRIRSIYARYVTATAVSFEQVPPDSAEIGRRMRARPRLPWLVVESAGQVAGYAYASSYHRRPAYRWAADCSVYVDRTHHSRGLGRMLYERLIVEVRHLGYVTLVAAITLPNGASVRLHETMGFQAIGTFHHAGHKHGAWHDVGWWQLALQEPPTAPAEPREWRPPMADDEAR
jgi:L-amino acid N-acyltransferase YncA